MDIDKYTLPKYKYRKKNIVDDQRGTIPGTVYCVRSFSLPTSNVQLKNSQKAENGDLTFLTFATRRTKLRQKTAGGGRQILTGCGGVWGWGLGCWGLARGRRGGLKASHGFFFEYNPRHTKLKEFSPSKNFFTCCVGKTSVKVVNEQRGLEVGFQTPF